VWHLYEFVVKFSNNTSLQKKIDEIRLSGNLCFPVRYISLIKKRALKLRLFRSLSPSCCFLFVLAKFGKWIFLLGCSRAHDEYLLKLPKLTLLQIELCCQLGMLLTATNSALFSLLLFAYYFLFWQIVINFTLGPWRFFHLTPPPNYHV